MISEVNDPVHWKTTLTLQLQRGLPDCKKHQKATSQVPTGKDPWPARARTIDWMDGSIEQLILTMRNMDIGDIGIAPHDKTLPWFHCTSGFTARHAFRQWSILVTQTAIKLLPPWKVFFEMHTAYCNTRKIRRSIVYKCLSCNQLIPRDTKRPLDQEFQLRLPSKCSASPQAGDKFPPRRPRLVQCIP